MEGNIAGLPAQTSELPAKIVENVGEGRLHILWGEKSHWTIAGIKYIQKIYITGCILLLWLRS